MHIHMVAYLCQQHHPVPRCRFLDSAQRLPLVLLSASPDLAGPASGAASLLTEAIASSGMLQVHTTLFCRRRCRCLSPSTHVLCMYMY